MQAAPAPAARPPERRRAGGAAEVALRSPAALRAGDGGSPVQWQRAAGGGRSVAPVALLTRCRGDADRETVWRAVRGAVVSPVRSWWAGGVLGCTGLGQSRVIAVSDTRSGDTSGNGATIAPGHLPAAGSQAAGRRSQLLGATPDALSCLAVLV